MIQPANSIFTNNFARVPDDQGLANDHAKSLATLHASSVYAVPSRTLFNVSNRAVSQGTGNMEEATKYAGLAADSLEAENPRPRVFRRRGHALQQLASRASDMHTMPKPSIN